MCNLCSFSILALEFASPTMGLHMWTLFEIHIISPIAMSASGGQIEHDLDMASGSKHVRRVKVKKKVWKKVKRNRAKTPELTGQPKPVLSTTSEWKPQVPPPPPVPPVSPAPPKRPLPPQPPLPKRLLKIRHPFPVPPELPAQDHRARTKPAGKETTGSSGGHARSQRTNSGSRKNWFGMYSAPCVNHQMLFGEEQLVYVFLLFCIMCRVTLWHVTFPAPCMSQGLPLTASLKFTLQRCNSTSVFAIRQCIFSQVKPA